LYIVASLAPLCREEDFLGNVRRTFQMADATLIITPVKVSKAPPPHL
jgi:hypothetical protein